MNDEMNFIDTHCHMNMMVDKDFNEPLRDEHFPLIQEIVEKAQAVGVTKIVNVGTSLAETHNCIAIAKRHKNVWASAGIHPCDCEENWLHDFKKIEQLVKEKSNKIVAIGETGLDFYHKPFFKQRQTDAFKAHIEVAIENGLPLVIHVREAADEALRVIDDYHKDIKGVLHCFMQQEYVAQQAIEWGLYLGIDAPITYPKNEWFRQLIKTLPLEHLIFETDAPFLPAQHMRGKQNGPQHLPSFAPVVAELKGLSLEVVADTTTKNAEKLFGI